MRAVLLLLIFVGLEFVNAAPVSAQGTPRFFTAADGQILNPDGDPVILRGLGLGGWLVPEGYMLRISAPDGGSPTSIRAQVEDLVGKEDADTFFRLYRDNYVEEKDIAAIAEWGYDHVRLPFHYKDFWDPDTEQIREEGFQLLDEFLGWCHLHGIEVVLDMHAAPGAQNSGNISDSDGEARLWTEPNPYQDWTVEIWTEIARRYAEDTLIIGYDLINEPVLPDGVPGSDLRDLYVRLTEAIREVDPNHILFIEGNWYATDFSALTPPFDDNMVYAFHKYWNSTSQGTIQYLIDIREQTGVPLWLGETGENSNAWFHAVRTMVESNGIGWNWWTHKKIETLTAPTSAPFAPGYAAVVAYWDGSGPRPSEADAREALYAMATGLDLDSTTTNEGVLAALLDDDFGTTARPFREHTIPGRIHAVDYDLGDQGVGYSDADPWTVSGSPGIGNTGGEYRNDGVDIEESTDPQGYDYNVGWIEALEWLQYTVIVEDEGMYDVEFRVASAGTGGQFAVSFDGELLGTVTAPGTGGWQTWRSVMLRGVELPAGEHVLRLNVRRGGFNLNTIRFEKAQGTPTEDEAIPEDTRLEVFPNPARDFATIGFRATRSSTVSLTVVDMFGRRTTIESDDTYGAGRHRIHVELPMASGTYMVELLVDMQGDLELHRVPVTVIR